MNISDLFAKASELYEQREYVEAFKQFMKLAECGDPTGMSMVATMYGSGQGVDLNFDESIAWDLRALESGNSMSILNLGITFRSKGDVRESRRWFEKALASGDGEAALELARLYMVSELEKKKVHDLLTIACESTNISEQSREEALALLMEFS